MTQERYKVYLRVSDGEEDTCLYRTEHWFEERPDIETVAALFDEAKRDYARLYPDEPAADYSVDVMRLRPSDQLPLSASDLRDAGRL